jgi:Glycosyl transferase family 2
LKLAVVTLVRNEIDIVGTFLSHLDALFDYAVLMDHGSIDGTERVLRDAVASRSGWLLWHIEGVGFHQAAYSAFAMDHLFRNTDADCVVLIDADEFVDVPDRASLEAALAGVAHPDRVGLLRWCKLVPNRCDTRAIRPWEEIWRAPDLGSLGKLVIPRAFHERHGDALVLSHGNHGVFVNETLVPPDDVGVALHLPIRSHAQLIAKTLASVFAVMSQAARNPKQSWHRFDILRRIAEGPLHDEDLIGIAAQYSESTRPPPMTVAGLAANGYHRAPLQVAFGRSFASPAEPLPIDPARLVAIILCRLAVEDTSKARLVLDGDQLRLLPIESPA